MSIFIVIVCAFVLYLFLLRRLADVVQPFRLQLAEVGEAALSRNPADAEQIRFYLDNAFNGAIVALGVLVFPFVALKVLVAGLKSKNVQKPPAQKTYVKIVALFLISVFAANPVCAIILIVEFLLLGLLLVLARGPSSLFLALMATVKAENSLRHYRLWHA